MIFTVAHQLHRFVLPPRHATLIRTKICSLSSIEADTFRKIVHQRKSCYRFQPHRRIDPNVLHDILKSTMVCYCFKFRAFERLESKISDQSQIFL